MKKSLVLIAGPTASGKSAAALELAEKTGGEIVNADAMQVYRDLDILSARPSAADMARAPHHLFGYLDASARCSAGMWARAAAEAIRNIHARAAPAIVVGGTGLYFRALTEGLSPIPDAAPEIRARAAARLDELGGEAFREEVIARDPPMARLAPADAQRLLRAWEVFEATGKPLSYFQSAPRAPLVEQVSARVVIEPEREALYAACDARFDMMLEQGGLEEARRLSARGLDPALPAMKALGAAELMAHLRGEMSLEEAAELARRNTRRFAKRQLTWFRNQAAEWPRAADRSEAISVVLT